MMRKYFLIVVIALIAVTANAQGVSIKNQIVEVKYNTLAINFDVNVDNLTIKSKEGLVLTPILQSNGKMVELSQIVINGRDRNIAYARDRSKLDDTPFIVVKRERKGTTSVQYKINIPFETWMEGSDLILNEEIVGCLNSVSRISNSVLANNISLPKKAAPIMVVVQPPITKIESVVEPIKRELDSLVAVIYFQNNITTIDLDYSSNRANIDKIDNALRNRETSVTSVKVVGSASPQGELKANEILSKERAIVLSDYLKTNLNIPSQKIAVDWIKEDWNTLKELVVKSNMEDKEQVVNIITNVAVFSGRELDLMNLNIGKPYNYMIVNFFPKLRRATCIVYYYVLEKVEP